MGALNLLLSQAPSNLVMPLNVPLEISKCASRGTCTPDLANTVRFFRFFSLETSPFLTADGITDFGIALAKHSISFLLFHSANRLIFY